jgi:hypothetical protein
MDDEIEKLSEELTRLSGADPALDSAGQNAVSALNQWRHHRDRSFIVHVVVWLYVGATGSLILFLFLRGLFSSDANAFSNLSDLLKVAVLPVVTLVIGYYFGTSKSE